jgi:type IV pilus assembly protein PilC
MDHLCVMTLVSDPLNDQALSHEIMNDVCVMTAAAVLLCLGLTAVLTRIRWPRNIRLTFIEALMITLGLTIILSIYSMVTGAEDNVFFLGGLIVLILAAGAVACWPRIKASVLRPPAQSIIRRGWIRIRPQLIERRKTDKAIVDHARAITRMNLPLAQGFFLAGQQTRGLAGVIMEAMASFLMQGLKLSEAYARYQARSALVLSMIQAGERCGQLPGVLGYVQDYLDRRQKQRQQWIAVCWPYPFIVLAVIFMIGTFLMAVIMPKFEQILEDFGAQAPEATRVLVRMVGILVQDNGSLPWLGLGILTVVLTVLCLQPRRYPVPRFYHRMMDQLAWRIPGWGAQCRYTDLAHAAAVLKLGLGSGMTLPEAMHGVADLDLNTVLRRRFVQFHERLARGEPTDQAGRAAHLPARFLWALRSGQDRETLHASLELTERYYSLVASHWFLAMNTLIWPVIIVALGVLIAFLALAFFMPLVNVINAVAAG